jgi:hypothetical protein
MSGERFVESDAPIQLDPIEPTAISPGLAAIPLAPTPWDDAEDGQHAVTPNGIVFHRRGGLWHMYPWWQNNGDGAEIAAICAGPDEWAFDLDWTRKHVEDAHGPLTFITLPVTYPHSDDRCRQDSVDADGFREACRQIARLADALGLGDMGMSLGEVVDAAIARILPPGKATTS